MADRFGAKRATAQAALSVRLWLALRAGSIALASVIVFISGHVYWSLGDRFGFGDPSNPIVGTLPIGPGLNVIVVALFALGLVVVPLARVPAWSRAVPQWSEPSSRRTVLKIAGTVHRVLYSWSGGLIGRRLRGRPVLLLTTTGRKTGRLRTWPLCYVVVDRDLVLVAAAGGDPRHPAWYLNLRAEPHVHIRQGNRLQTMLARTVEGSERARLWQHVVHQFPVCVGYQRTTRREIPVVLLRPATS